MWKPIAGLIFWDLIGKLAFAGNLKRSYEGFKCEYPGSFRKGDWAGTALMQSINFTDSCENESTSAYSPNETAKVAKITAT